MCIIIVKPSGVELPSDNLLRAAAALNRDGCGFMTDDGVVYHALYRDLDLFLSVLRRRAPKEAAAAVHFRMATHGSVSLKNCHPFNYQGELFMMHNGVLPIESRHDLTDSEIYLRRVGGRLARHGLVSGEAVRVFDVRGNRFAVLDAKRRHIALFGDFQTVGGVSFSNMRPFLQHKIITGGGRLDVAPLDAPPLARRVCPLYFGS